MTKDWRWAIGVGVMLGWAAATPVFAETASQDDADISEEVTRAGNDLERLAQHLNEYQSKLKTLLKESGYGETEEVAQGWDPQVTFEDSDEVMMYRFDFAGVRKTDMAARIRNNRFLEVLGIHEIEGTFQKTIALPERARSGASKGLWDKEVFVITIAKDRRFVKDEVETVPIQDVE